MLDRQDMPIEVEPNIMEVEIKEDSAEVQVQNQSIDLSISEQANQQTDLNQPQEQSEKQNQIQQPNTSEKNVQQEEVKETNQFLYNTNSAQKLTQEEIKKIQKENPNQILQKLAQNSQTFDSKTKFAKEKWLKKKKQKHFQNNFMLMQCNEFNLFETLYNSMQLKFDILGFGLSMANIKYGQRIFAWDLKGVITGAVINRSTVKASENLTKIFTIQDKQSKQSMMKYFNLSQYQKQALQVLEVEKLHEFQWDSIVIYSDEIDKELFSKIFQSLSPYCGRVNARKMVEQLFDNKCIDIQLNEMFTREYQIIPQRTHPLMKPNLHSSYVVTAIKVVV